MAFCGYCGNNVPEGMRFCTSCGKPVTVVNDNNENDMGTVKMTYGPVVPKNPANPPLENQTQDDNTGFGNNPNVQSEKIVNAESINNQLEKADKKQNFHKYSWMIGVALFILSLIDYWSDPPAWTILLSLLIIGFGIGVFVNSYKGKIITGIAMALAAYCFLCGVYQGLGYGFFYTPISSIYTNTLQSNGSSNSSSSSSSSNSSSSSSNNIPSSNSSSSRVDPELKAFLDSYEDFMDDYVAFMKKYTSDPNNAFSMMGDYMEMLQKYEEFATEAEKYNPDKMSTADAEYYLEVMTRIEKKMLEIY